MYDSIKVINLTKNHKLLKVGYSFLDIMIKEYKYVIMFVKYQTSIVSLEEKIFISFFYISTCIMNLVQVLTRGSQLEHFRTRII